MESGEEIQRLSIKSELDLHLFKPAEAADLVQEYLQECRRSGILRVRIVHGKGKGVLCRRIHSVLESLDFVDEYEIDWTSRGSWGATIAWLKPLP